MLKLQLSIKRIIVLNLIIFSSKINSQPIELTPQKNIRIDSSEDVLISLKKLPSGEIYLQNRKSEWFFLNEQQYRLEKPAIAHLLPFKKVVDFWVEGTKTFILESLSPTRYAFSIIEDSSVLKKQIQPIAGTKALLPISFVVTRQNEIVLTATQFDKKGYSFHKFNEKFEFQSSFAQVVDLPENVSIFGKFYYVHSTYHRQKGYVLAYSHLPIIESYKSEAVKGTRIIFKEIQAQWFNIGPDSSFYIDHKYKAYPILGKPIFTEQGTLWISAITKRGTEKYTDLWTIRNNKPQNIFRIRQYEIKSILFSLVPLKLFALTKNELLFFDLPELDDTILKIH